MDSRLELLRENARKHEGLEVLDRAALDEFRVQRRLRIRGRRVRATGEDVRSKLAHALLGRAKVRRSLGRPFLAIEDRNGVVALVVQGEPDSLVRLVGAAAGFSWRVVPENRRWCMSYAAGRGSLWVAGRWSSAFFPWVHVWRAIAHGCAAGLVLVLVFSTMLPSAPTEFSNTAILAWIGGLESLLFAVLFFHEKGLSPGKAESGGESVPQSVWVLPISMAVLPVIVFALVLYCVPFLPGVAV